MTTITRRKREARGELGPYRRHELLTGEIYYPAFGYTGYGDGTGTDLAAFICEDMRLDWEANRTELLWFCASHERRAKLFADEEPWWLALRGSFAVLPWASEQFDSDPDAVRHELRTMARPHRAAYAADLTEAQEWAKYCREVIAHPERGGQGSDPQSSQDMLQEALAAVERCKKLLSELDAT